MASAKVGCPRFVVLHPRGLTATRRCKAVISPPTKKDQTEGKPVLTRDILFGMNILTLVGFVVMGLTLTLNRMGQAGKALSIGLMTAGTALVFLGLYAGGGLW
jgi:hypothetical protein